VKNRSRRKRSTPSGRAKQKHLVRINRTRRASVASLSGFVQDDKAQVPLPIARRCRGYPARASTSFREKATSSPRTSTNRMSFAASTKDALFGGNKVIRGLVASTHRGELHLKFYFTLFAGNVMGIRSFAASTKSQVPQNAHLHKKGEGGMAVKTSSSRSVRRWGSLRFLASEGRQDAELKRGATYEPVAGERRAPRTRNLCSGTTGNPTFKRRRCGTRKSEGREDAGATPKVLLVAGGLLLLIEKGATFSPLGLSLAQKAA
jgi:hypothetical protein